MEYKQIGEDDYVSTLEYVTYPTDPMQLKWCCFCILGAMRDGETVCLNSKLLDLVWNRPKIVNDFGSCKCFIHRRSKEADSKEFKGFKRKLLESTGVVFQERGR